MNYRATRKYMADHVRYTYLKVGNAVVTIAGARHPDSPIWQYGISFCSPNDRFVRKAGRHAAVRRMLGIPLTNWNGQLQVQQNEKHADCAWRALKATIEDAERHPSLYPGWFLKEASKGCKFWGDKT